MACVLPRIAQCACASFLIYYMLTCSFGCFNAMRSCLIEKTTDATPAVVIPPSLPIALDSGRACVLCGMGSSRDSLLPLGEALRGIHTRGKSREFLFGMRHEKKTPSFCTSQKPDVFVVGCACRNPRDFSHV